MASVDVAIEGGLVNIPGPPSEGQTPDKRAFAAMVQRKWKEGSEPMLQARRDYWENLAFYLGHQWFYWDRVRNIPRSLPQDYSPLGRGRMRLTVNRFGPNLLNLIGRMLKAELSGEVVPSDQADNLVEGARRGERVLQAYHDDQSWESIRFDALLASFLGGTAAVCDEWDPMSGTPLEYDMASDRVVCTGDVRLRSLNVNEFCLEPGVRHYLDARWWIMALALPTRTVKESYGLNWTPLADASAGTDNALNDSLLEAQGRPYGRDMCRVMCYYERPSGKEKGRYGVVVNGITIYLGKWPFPSPEINVTLFRQKRIDGRYLGTTLLNDAIPLQTAYNNARSVLAEHMKLAGNARIMAPFGAFDEEDLHDTAGSILWYAPDVAGSQPSYLAPPNLPRWLTAEAGELASELDNIMLVHDINRGQGFDRASASALALLSEKDDTPLSPMVFEQREGWRRIYSRVLQMLGEKVTETREAHLRIGAGTSERVKWNGRMLQGQYRVEIPLDAVTPRTHAQRAMFAKDLWDRKILTDARVYARMVGLPPDEFEQLLDADAAKANIENLVMAMGTIEIPADFDNHATHISEHNRWRKSTSYRYAPAEIRSIFDDHIKYHEQKAHAEFGKQMARADANPAFAALPQANEPAGSMVPPPAQEQQAAMMMAQGGGGGAQQPSLGAGGTSPGMESGIA